MDGQFRSTWDFIDISDACLKTFKIPHYGFPMLSLDLPLTHSCISYVSAKFLGKDLLSQCIFLSIRCFKGFRDLLKQVVTFDGVKKILRDQRSETYEQMVHRTPNRALEIFNWRFIIIISYYTRILTRR